MLGMAATLAGDHDDGSARLARLASPRLSERFDFSKHQTQATSELDDKAGSGQRPNFHHVLSHPRPLRCGRRRDLGPTSIQLHGTLPPPSGAVGDRVQRLAHGRRDAVCAPTARA